MTMALKTRLAAVARFLEAQKSTPTFEKTAEMQRVALVNMIKGMKLQIEDAAEFSEEINRSLFPDSEKTTLLEVVGPQCLLLPTAVGQPPWCRV